MPFPILADPMLKLYEETAIADETPYILLIRKKQGSALVLMATHGGTIKSPEAIVAEIKTALAVDWDAVLKMAQKIKHSLPKSQPLKDIAVA